MVAKHYTAEDIFKLEELRPDQKRLMIHCLVAIVTFYFTCSSLILVSLRSISSALFYFLPLTHYCFNETPLNFHR